MLAILLLAGTLPFLNKPVHIDDANFLTLARGAADNPWRPHAIEINWQGITQPAFDVLSNPPGIGWWLAGVVEAPIWVQHLWMLPWLFPMAWGAWTLGETFARRPLAAGILMGASPVAILAAHSLLPDLPLYACTLAGMAGVTRPGEPNKNPWKWALVAGCSALFRYSGIVLIPLVVLWGLLQRTRRDAVVLGLAASVPIVALISHDLFAYGKIHILSMVEFQSVADTPRDIFRKLVATLSMLGGVVALPVLGWNRWKPTTIGVGIGAGLGVAAATLSQQSGNALLGTVVFAAAGGGVLASALRLRRREDLWLSIWLVGGMLFLLKLRFVAGRYWLPFAAPAVLLPLQLAPRGLVRTACVLTPILALLLAIDDRELAVAQEAAAITVSESGDGIFAGHWGWQHHLEARGWRPLEEDEPIPPDTLFAVSSVSWPQEAAPSCLTPLSRMEFPDRWPGPRVHTREGAANIHAYLISSRPPVETTAPWGFGKDPHDVVTLWRGCAAPIDASDTDSTHE